MKLIIESILECFVENINSEIKSDLVKMIFAIIFVRFYLFLVAGFMGFGIDIFRNDSFLGLFS